MELDERRLILLDNLIYLNRTTSYGNESHE